jgi:hypothetical protein
MNLNSVLGAHCIKVIDGRRISIVICAGQATAISNAMVVINSIEVSPPLLNSSCAWSSSLQDLQALYDSPYTGAITTRTATQDGFSENDTHIVTGTILAPRSQADVLLGQVSG